MHIDLTLIWAGIIAFAILVYVVMDGFDLGIGILYPGLKPGAERDAAMNSIAPFWDGNETWLVMGGGGMLAVFPLAYAVILPATYPLIIAMLLGLILRGVAFEFRWRDKEHEPLWDRAFWAGSLIAALSQGMILGALLQGIKVENAAYAGSWYDWLTPFTLLTGIGVAIGYALLAAGWLIWRTEGATHLHARRMLAGLTIATVGAMAVVSLATVLLDQEYWRRWLTLPTAAFCAVVPVLVAACAIGLLRCVDGPHERRPFLLALAMFVLGFAGLGISIWPNIIPPSVTIWEAAAPPESQAFLLVGAVVILPLILGYTAWSYWVFRGKAGSGYH